MSIAVISFVFAGLAFYLKPEFVALLAYCGLASLLLETTIHGNFLLFLTKRQGAVRAASYIFLLYMIDLAYVIAVLKAVVNIGDK